MNDFASTPELILLPAVDVADGKAVRLTQGEAGTETSYGDPVEAALRIRTGERDAAAEGRADPHVPSELSRQRLGQLHPQALLDEVAAVLTNADVRPLTDEVAVQSAEIVPYAIRGRVYTYAGPDSAVVMREAQRSLQAYLAWQKQLSAWIDDSDLSPDDRARARFLASLMSDALSPSNSPLNPQAVKELFNTGGSSLLKGVRHLFDDLVCQVCFVFRNRFYIRGIGKRTHSDTP